jgi:proline iminopeptidase
MAKKASVRAVALLLLLLPAAAAAQDGTFDNRGLTLHYRSIGSGPALVILSGGPGFDVDYMQPVADALPAYRRILFEQRGTGRSQPKTLRAEDMTLDVAVEDLDALRQHLGLDQLLLAGHSWGGMLAMAYAAAHPDRVDRLILIESGGPTLDFQQWFGDNIRARMRPEDIEAERYWAEAARNGLPPAKAAIESLKAVTPAYFFDRARGLEFAATMKDGMLHVESSDMLFADLMKQYDLRDRLRQFDRPTLIIQGHQDPIGDKTAEDIHALISSSTLAYIDQCGHFPWLEQPQAFQAAIDSFLNGAGRQP